jgi:ADP-dependent phosphofructokinase/glucokinase
MKIISLFVNEGVILPRLSLTSIEISLRNAEGNVSYPSNIYFNILIDKNLDFSFNNYGCKIDEKIDNNFLVSVDESNFLEIVVKDRQITQVITLVSDYSEPIFERYQHVDFYKKIGNSRRYIKSIVWNTVNPTQDYIFVNKKSGIPLLIHKG